MLRNATILLGLVISCDAYAAGWYIQEQLVYPMRFKQISNERFSFKSGDLPCWVSAPEFVRLPDAMHPGSTYVQESRELACRLPDGHELFTMVFVPADATEFSSSRSTLHIRKDGKLSEPTLAWSNQPLLGPAK